MKNVISAVITSQSTAIWAKIGLKDERKKGPASAPLWSMPMCQSGNRGQEGAMSRGSIPKTKIAV